MPNSEDSYLYEQIARDLGQAVNKGVYETGQKLPSLRYISEQYEVSMATVIQAYQALEQKGLIESRPRSGFVVRESIIDHLAEPELTRPGTAPTTVSVGQLAMSLINEARQPGMLRLGAAVPEPALLPMGSLSRTMAGVARRYPRATASYEDQQGNMALRKQIVRLMRESGVRCTAQDILVTNGCLESLSLAVRAVARSGDSIAIESPTYFGVLQVIESLGMKAVEVATHPSTGIDVTALNKSITTRKIAACVLMPTFNNPIGSTMPDTNKQQVVELLSKKNIPLIEDDIYGSLSYTAKRPRAARAFDETGNVLYCSSFSKTVAPGMRIGWILAGKYHEQIRYQKFLDNISTTTYPQLVLAEFLAKGSYRQSIRRAARIYARRMEQLRRWVSEYFPKGTRITNPQGGFLLWVELPKQYDALKIYRKALDKKIAITPGILFSAQGQYKNHIRLSCGSVEGEQMRKSIMTIAKLF